MGHGWHDEGTGIFSRLIDFVFMTKLSDVHHGKTDRYCQRYIKRKSENITALW